ETPHLEDIDVAAVQETIRNALARDTSTWLTPDEVETVLRSYGLPSPRGVATRSPEEAAAAFREIGARSVAVKLISGTVLHKTDVGGVELGIETAEEAAEAYRRMEASLRAHGLGDAFEGALVQEMVTGGVECLVGVVNDALFGPLIAFGLGGTVAEAMGD